MPFKRIIGVVGAVAIALTVCAPAFAAPKFQVNGIVQPVGNLTPFMEKGVLYVPAKFVAQGLNAQIKWHAKLETAIIINEKDAKTLIVTVGKRFAISNNSFVDMQSAPKIVKGSIFIPLRPIATAFGAKISWDAKKEIAYMNTLGAAPAVVEIPVVVPVVVEKKEPVAIPVMPVTPAAVQVTSAAVTLTQSAVQTQVTQAAVEVNQDESSADLSGMWEDKSANSAYFYQSGKYVSGKYTVNSKTGVMKGEATADGISGVYWQGGKEGTFSFLVDAVSGALRGTMDGKDVELSHVQKGYLIDSDKIATMNGKWMDIWGNIVSIEQSNAKDASRIVNGTYVNAEGKDMGTFKGTFKSGIYSGEYVQNESKDKGPGVFAFTLNTSGMSYNGKYSLPGSKEMSLPWDAIRITY